MRVPLINRLHRISNKNLKVVPEKGKLKIFFDNNELTKDVGFTSSVRILEKWYDCSKTKWKVKRISPWKLQITSLWENLDTSQVWIITLKSDSEIEWESYLKTNKEQVIDECKIGIMLSNKYTNWLNATQQGILPYADRDWQDMQIHDPRCQFIGIYSNRNEIKVPNPLIFDFSINEGPLQPQVQVAPKDINANVISAYSLGLRNSNIYIKGIHKIATTNIRIFENPDILKKHFYSSQTNKTIEQRKNTFLKPSDKNADVLLIMPPPWQTKMPPLGIAYLCSYLKQKNYKPAVSDLNLELFNNAIGRQTSLWDISTINHMSPHSILKYTQHHFGQSINDFVSEILSTNIKIIALSVTFVNLLIAEYIAELIKLKDPSRTIIIGGPGCFWPCDRKLLTKNVIDAFVLGEGENPLGNILDRIAINKNFEGIKAVTKNFEKIEIDPILEISSIPYPSFEEFEIHQYNKGHDYKPLPILASRGCIGKCTYCVDRHMLKPFRTRTPQNIVSEIKNHIKNHNVKNFEFNDLLCNGSLQHLEELCDLITKEKLDIVWTSYAMIRKNISSNLLEKMKTSGCNDICYGVESGSDNTLRKMNKFYTTNDAQDLIRRTKASGIITRINIIVGYPLETKDDFKQTLNFIKRNKNYIDEITNVSEFVLNPGSDIGNNPEKYEVKLEDHSNLTKWEDSQGLNATIRKERLIQTVSLINSLKIKTTIINSLQG